MRLGMVVYGGLDGGSGGYLYDRRLVERLRARGHEVEVVALPRRGYAASLLDNGPATAGLADLDVDVLLQDELCHPSLVFRNRRLDGVPVVAIVHHLRCREPRAAPLNAVSRAVERRYLDTVDAFVYNSGPTRRSVEALVGPTEGVVAPPGRDHVSPAVTAADVRARAHEPGPLRVASVGAVTERKGLHTLLRGLAQVDRAWSLTVVGDRTVEPGYADRVERLAARLGIEAAVDFRGRVPDDELADVLATHQLFALPSGHEGFGIAYLEAMGYGLPPVASAAGGASDLVADGETGLLVPPDDPAAVAGAVGSLAADRDRLARLGVAALERFRDHPTWDDAAAGVERLLADVAGEAAGN